MLSCALLVLLSCSDRGNPISCSESLDCIGECGGSAVIDCAGTCNGSAILDGTNCTNISFFATIQPILTTNCTNCHDDNHSTELDLTSHSTILAGSSSRLVIISGNHSSSPLWSKINSGDMPMGTDKLPDSQIEFIATWINESAKNN